MLTREVFDKARDLDCEQVVTHISGVVFKRGMTNCPFPDHEDKDASFSLFKKKNKWTCFGCEKSGSTIDFVMRYKGVEQNEAVEILAQTFGINTHPHGGTRKVDKIPTGAAKGQPAANLQAVSHITEAQRTKNAMWLQTCTANRGADDYFRERGFTDDTIKRFHLGYDKSSMAAVIPYSADFDYYTAKLLKPPQGDSGHRKPKNTEWGEAKLFNEAALDTKGVVFIVESQTCAISIIQEGGQALGLGGTGYTRMLFHEIEKRGGCKDIVFVLAFDNDPQGKKTQAEFVPKLKAAGVRFIECSVQGDKKDPNDLLKLDPKQLRTNIQKAMQEAEKVEHTRTTAARKEDEVKALLARELKDASDAFNPEYLDALGYAKHNLAAEYSLFKMQCRKLKVSTRDLDRSIEPYAKEYRGLAKANAEPPLELQGLDLGGAVAPKGWQINTDGGIRKFISTQHGEHEIVACYNAVVVTARLNNIEDGGDQRLEITFDNDGKWTKLVGLRPQFSSRNAIVEMSKKGLRATSETAKDLVIFLAEYEAQNRPLIPQKKSTAKVGWLSATQFFPFAMDGEEVVFEEGNGGIFAMLTSHGDKGKWEAMMRELRKNKFARFITSASFASPLLIRMRCRPFIIHTWHSSGAGKTAVLKAAISVWGDPDGIMDTLNATPVGLEQSAGIHNNLPYFIDEKQVGDENKNPLSRVVYMLGGGHGKTRGARGGGLAHKVRWHNVVMITGEEPITSGSSKDGVQTRTIELYGKPVDDTEDKDFASKVHTISEDNYGFAGEAFIKMICDRLKTEPQFLVRLYTKVHAKLQEKYARHIHLEYIAAVIVTDYLVETLIFGTDDETAAVESFANGCAIYENNKEQLHKDNIETAYEFTLGWLGSNGSRFEDNNHTSQPQFGKKEVAGEVTTYFLIPSIFETALTDANYNVSKIIQGFKERGYIYSGYDKNGDPRKKFSKTINGVEIQCYKLVIDKRKPKPRQMEIADLEPINDEDLPF